MHLQGSQPCFHPLLALTALTNKRWLYGVAMAPTALGIVMGLAGLFNWNLRVDALMKFLS